MEIRRENTPTHPDKRARYKCRNGTATQAEYITLAEGPQENHNVAYSTWNALGEIMFKTIMVPVDLRHEENLRHSLDVVGHLAKADNAKVVFVGVSLSAPTEVAHNPKEFKAKLAYFTREQSRHYGFEAECHPVFSVDPAADLNKKLLETIDEVDADLVLMATHIPNVSDYLFANHGSYIATHCKTSVFLVRAP